MRRPSATGQILRDVVEDLTLCGGSAGAGRGGARVCGGGARVRGSGARVCCGAFTLSGGFRAHTIAWG